MIALLKKIVDESSDLICALDIEGKILWIGKSSEKILGIKASRLSGRLYSELVHEEDLQKWENVVKREVSGEDPVKFDIRHIHKEGAEVLLQCSATWDSSDEKAYCVGKRISANIDTEDELRSSDKMYQVLFDLSPIPKHVYDLKTLQILDVNQAAIDQYGYSRDEFLAMKIQDLRPEREIPTLMKAIEKYKKTTGIIRFGVFEHLKKNGSIIKMDISGQKFSHLDQTRAMVICNDVTRHQSELIHKKLLADIRQIFGQEKILTKILEDLLAYIIDKGEFHLGEIWLTNRYHRTLNLTTTFPKSDFTSLFYENSREIKVFKKGIGLPGNVWNGRKTQIWDRLEKLKKFTRKKAARKVGMESAIGIPMIYGEEVLGVLLLGSKKNGQNFDSFKNLYTELETVIGSELKRKQLEEDYNQIFNTAPDIICMIDFESSFKRINPAGCELLGYSEDQLLNMPYSELIFTDDRDKFEKQIEEYIKGETASNFIHRVVTRSGKIVWLDWNLSKYTEDGISYGVAKNITEQNELQKLLDDATNLAKIGGWEMDLRQEDTDNMYWSPMTRKILEVEESYNPSLSGGFEFYNDKNREKIQGAVDRTIHSGESFDLELLITTANGNKKWIRCLGEAEIVKKKTIKIFGSYQDITKRKTAELAAQEALVERNTILESISDALFAVDREWKVTYWNREAEEVLGKSSLEIVGKNLWDVYDNVVEHDFYTQYHRAMETGESVSFETHYPTLEKWFEVSVYPSDNGLSVYFKDVTLRKISNEKIRQSNERFKNVAKATNDAIYDWNIENNMLFLGDGFKLLFGHDFKKSVHSMESWIYHLHPEDKEAVLNELNLVLQNKEEVTLFSEYRYLKSDGTYAYVINRGIVIRDESGNPQRIVGAVTDITQRKKYEESLQGLNETLEQHAKELAISNRELEQFAFVTSHDLQEPLRMISSFLTQLERKYGDQLDEKAHQYIHFAVDGANRMRQIILDLLDFITIGKSIDCEENVDINEIVEETCILQRKAIEETNAIIEKEGLPTLSTQRTVIDQIFLNLIGNAIKYRKEEAPPRVVVSAKETKKEWIFSIKDNGIGIEEEYYDKIFSIFQKLHTKEEYGGTGMGLAIVKKSVESLGGRIWVESTPGFGSNFMFTIQK